MPAVTTILVIESDATRRKELTTILEFIDHAVVIAAESKGWRDAVGLAGSVHIVLLGNCGSIRSRIEVLGEVKEWSPQAPVLLLVDSADKYNISQELVSGTLGRVDVPLKYAQLSYALQQAQVYRDSHEPSNTKRPLEVFRSLVGNSRSIRAVRKLIEQVAETDATVLILGESGTGKEVVARNIHYYSSRRDKPFVPVNCGAIPPDLLESELFGHEKGAFTGAISARQGRFELAESGTLFLDEIGDMGLSMQVKLLRVLQERTFERVGSNKQIHVNLRIIAATHIKLEEAIHSGRFREDLFYRLNVFPIDMPPLRERIEDIPLLVNELILRIEHEKRGSVRLTPAAVLVLCQYPWTGNVRELANLIERLAILYPYGVVDVVDLPEKFRAGAGDDATSAESAVDEEVVMPSLLQATHDAQPRLPRKGIDLKEHMQQLEATLIQQALEESNGVVAHAATLLKMRRTTLVEKMRKLGLSRADATSDF
ncbi:MAG: sigma-54 dependent transcriptional regulator [Gammaproteobacteria bacterium]|nr:sigma-54 dependent transcriptional regulator [Gammaproteobacteria bacterium]